jgi:hypothetical protein
MTIPLLVHVTPPALHLSVHIPNHLRIYGHTSAGSSKLNVVMNEKRQLARKNTGNEGTVPVAVKHDSGCEAGKR